MVACIFDDVVNTELSSKSDALIWSKFDTTNKIISQTSSIDINWVTITSKVAWVTIVLRSRWKTTGDGSWEKWKFLLRCEGYNI